MTGGMDNPVDVVFTPGGERIFSTTFLTHPAGGKRDGLIHAIYGGVYGKASRRIDGHKLTGELMPPLVHLGPAAACGLVRVRVAGVRRRLPGQPLRLLLQHAQARRGTCSTPQGASFTRGDKRLPRLQQSRFSSDRRDGRRRRQPDRDRHGRLVQTLLPHVAALEARYPGGHLPRSAKAIPEVDDLRGLEIVWAKASQNALRSAWVPAASRSRRADS